MGSKHNISKLNMIKIPFLITGKNNNLVTADHIRLDVRSRMT